MSERDNNSVKPKKGRTPLAIILILSSSLINQVLLPVVIGDIRLGWPIWLCLISALILLVLCEFVLPAPDSEGKWLKRLSKFRLILPSFPKTKKIFLRAAPILKMVLRIIFVCLVSLLTFFVSIDLGRITYTIICLMAIVLLLVMRMKNRNLRVNVLEVLSAVLVVLYVLQLTYIYNLSNYIVNCASKIFTGKPFVREVYIEERGLLGIYKTTGSGKCILPDGSYYEGDFVNDRFHGHGKHTWPDGGYYEGEFAASERNGHGKFTWPDGSCYEGDFVDDKGNGHGKFTWPDGRYYEGDFVDNKRNGYGKLIWPDGSFYDGDFVDGKRTGHGKFTWSDDSFYEGGYANNLRNGRGQLIWPDGSFYISDFSDGRIDGRGIGKAPDGSFFEGDFVYDPATGYIFIWIDSKIVYAGQLSDFNHEHLNYDGDKELDYLFKRIKMLLGSS